MKWLRFAKWHVPMHNFDTRKIYPDLKLNKGCFKGPDDKYAYDAVYGILPIRRQPFPGSMMTQFCNVYMCTWIAICQQIFRQNMAWINNNMHFCGLWLLVNVYSTFDHTEMRHKWITAEIQIQLSHNTTVIISSCPNFNNILALYSCV